jgi:predicted DNA-binding mobile mystery protein A
MSAPTILLRHQLDDALQTLAPLARLARPPSGWVRALREALGMTRAALARRLGVKPQTVSDLEQAEVDRRITLDSLDRLAQAMGCRVVYALVPEAGSLDATIEARAEVVASDMLARTAHTMALEKQALTPAQLERRRKELVNSLLHGSPRKLW